MVRETRTIIISSKLLGFSFRELPQRGNEWVATNTPTKSREQKVRHLGNATINLIN